MSDPRKAETLGEACANPGGKTYNGYKLLSFLSEACNPGKGLSDAEARMIADDVIRRKNEQGK